MDDAARVDASAHRYRNVLVDRNGQPIDRRNAWEARAQVYNRSIGPGAAEVVRYRIDVPLDFEGPVTFSARLNYRKFQQSLTEFAFSKATPRTPAAEAANTPQLPVVVMADAEVTLSSTVSGAADPTDWERWNDYGIGLLLQDDLTGSQQAFERVTELVPDLPDGWANLGRVYLARGAHPDALDAFHAALDRDPSHPAAALFRARTLHAMGQPEPAAIALLALQARFPNDRNIARDLGRIRLSQERYLDSAAHFQAVLAIDPEDADAHYNLARAYRASGRADISERYEALFQRFKPDESARALAADYRRRHLPENLETQPVHEHGPDGAFEQ